MDKSEKYILTLESELIDVKTRNKVLLETHKNFNKVFYNAVDAVLLISDNQFVDCNMSAIHMLCAVDKSHLLSTHPSELSPEFQPDGQPSREKADKMIAMAFKKGFLRFEWRHKKVTGEEIPVEVSLTVITIEGKDVIHCLWKDLSDQKRAEDVLRDAITKAEDSNRIKSDFLATMSHEIRSPMTAILGVSELINNTDLNNEQQDFVKIIQRSSSDLLTIINDLLDYSKIEAKKMEIDEVSFNLPKLLEACVAPYLIMAESHIAIKLLIDSNASLQLRGDPKRLSQIISNLLGNAFKFTSKGTVKLQIKVERRTNQRVTIGFSVIDTGIGIPEHQQKFLFEPFTQADQSTSRKYGGTGLGLAICKRLVEAMGGSIAVTSQMGVGSKFQFTIDFPIVGEAVAPLMTPEITADFTNFRVLLVEDNLVNQIVISKMMKSLMVDVQLVSNGAAAVNIVCQKDNNFDLVFMDCEMPGMDGYTATTKIRDWEISNNQPAIIICALTAHAMSEHVRKCRKAGMDDHLSKPVKLVELQTMLTKIKRNLDVV